MGRVRVLELKSVHPILVVGSDIGPSCSVWVSSLESVLSGVTLNYQPKFSTCLINVLGSDQEFLNLLKFEININPIQL